MPTFLFKVRNMEGRTFSGVMDAPDTRALKRILHESDFFVVSLGLYRPRGSFSLLSGRVHPDTLIMFTRQLASMLEAGMKIMTALDTIWKGMENQRMQIIISRMRNRLTEGSSFSSAADEFPEVFPVVYRKLLLVAETGAGLVPVLYKLVQYLEKQEEMNNRIKRATLYPLFVSCFAVVVLVLMLVLVVPMFYKVFHRIHVPLPFLTRVTVAISGALRTPWFWIITAFVVASAVLVYKRLLEHSEFLDHVKLKLPLFGKRFYLASIERFVRSLGLLLGAGLPIIVSIEATKDTVINKELEDALETARKRLVEGVPFSQALRETNCFPSFLLEMVNLGEQTGELSVVLEKTANHFYSELDSRIQKFLTLLDPVLIVVVGAIVCFILLSIYMPIFSLWEAIPGMR